jgi:hypothetical protein
MICENFFSGSEGSLKPENLALPRFHFTKLLVHLTYSFNHFLARIRKLGMTNLLGCFTHER